MSDLLIKNGFIATMDGRGTVYRQGSLYVKNDRIEHIGETVDCPSNPDCMIDAEHKVVLPGFVNVHSHLQQYFRGVYESMGEFYRVNLPLEGYRQPDDMDKLALASCAEFIYGGSTTSMVIYTYPDGFAKAVEKAGNRCILAADIEEVNLTRLIDGVYEYLPEKGAAAFSRAKELCETWHGKAEGRITTVICPKAPDLATADTYRRCKEYADLQGLRMTTHLSQSWREVKQVEKLYGKTPPQHLKEIGILDNQLTGAHCTFATEKDIQLIARSGMGILHCRSVTNPIIRWMDMGIAIGLGTDDYHHDMLQLLRQNIAGQSFRGRMAGGAEEMLASNRSSIRPSHYELLELATRKGAETVGIDGEVGSLEPGKKADIITINLDNPYLTPTKDPLTSVVLYAGPADIDDVIVDGKVLKRDGALTTINMREALQTAQERVDEIVSKFFHDYPDQREIWEKTAPYLKS